MPRLLVGSGEGRTRRRVLGCVELEVPVGLACSHEGSETSGLEIGIHAVRWWLMPWGQCQGRSAGRRGSPGQDVGTTNIQRKRVSRADQDGAAGKWEAPGD